MPIVNEINDIFETLHDLSDEEVKLKTEEFKQIIREHMEQFDPYESLEKNDPERNKKALENEVKEINQVLDELLPEAFAVVKEACRRMTEREHTFELMGHKTVWNMIPYDVQLIGGMMLHRGKIAEMATGEGKTLVATLPLYLNALAGRGAHLITVNDYLAERDSQWMGQVFDFLGLSVGCIKTQMSPMDRKEQYGSDITYGTNNEFGFDYLRDNMSIEADRVVQRGHHYAIVDEVDSVLIDEARTPLIIAGPVPRSSEDDFNKWNASIQRLVRRQRDLVSRLVNEAEKVLGSDDESLRDGEFEAAKKLLVANKGLPKHKRVLKALSEPGRKSMILEVENVYIRDKKQQELTDDLYYAIDEKQHTIDLTDKGREELSKIENVSSDFFILPDLSEQYVDIENDTSLSEEEKAAKKLEAEQTMAEKSSVIHSVNQLLRAHSMYEKDQEYVIENGKIQIVDEFTGRIMYGRRYSDGLHQAIEAKEGVQVQEETQTIASITLQNYFRLYGKLAGMTGTAETEEDEFFKIYSLEVAVIPTNKPVIRADEEDLIYRTKREKYKAIIDEIIRLYELGLPVLVGTTSVETSELIAKMLGAQTVNGQKMKNRFQVLNAKQHQSEAEIVTNAGRPGAITIATNMAGRGTDIKIGPEIIDAHGEDGIITRRLEEYPGLRDEHIKNFGIDPADPDQTPGGLQILGTERHESRRIDRQLRGRSGRQGDPGRSIFYLSIEDDLMRLFGGERIGKIMDTLGLQEGEVITNPMVTRAIEKAQKRVEQHNFSIREHLLKYDDVMNVQREVVYARRREALFGDIHKEVDHLVDEYVAYTLDSYCDPRERAYAWDLEGLRSSFLRTLMIDLHFTDEDIEGLEYDDLEEILYSKAPLALQRQKEQFGEELYERVLRFYVLRVIDQQWMDHLYEMDRLKEGIGLRSYAQRDPLIEYKRDGLQAFEAMLGRVAELSLKAITSARLKTNQQMADASSSLKLQGKEIKKDAGGMGYSGQPSAGDSSAASGESAGGQQRSLSRAARRRHGVNEGGTAVKADPVRRNIPKVGRNDLCPCGSGKKYKHCHGR